MSEGMYEWEKVLQENRELRKKYGEPENPRGNFFIFKQEIVDILNELKKTNEKIRGL